jgi:hypothetical protein
LGVPGLVACDNKLAPVQGSIYCYVDYDTGGVTGLEAHGSKSCAGEPQLIPIEDGIVTDVKVTWSPKGEV